MVFTGGIGEHSGRIRTAFASRLKTLGVDANGPADLTGDQILSGAGALPAILRIEAREDAVVAHQVVAAL